MNSETIKAVKTAHPEAFAAKRAVGLTDEQAATVILTQLEEDKAKSPGAVAFDKARSLVSLARVRFDQLKSLFVEAAAAVQIALDANPGIAETSPDLALPHLIVDSSGDARRRDEDYKAKVLQVTDLANQVLALKDDVLKRDQVIEDLKMQLATATAAKPTNGTSTEASSEEKSESTKPPKAKPGGREDK